MRERLLHKHCRRRERPSKAKRIAVRQAVVPRKVGGNRNVAGLSGVVLQFQSCVKAHVSATCTRSIWNKRLGHCSRDMLRASLPHVPVTSKHKVVKANDCQSCAFGTSVREPRKTVAHKDKIAAIPLERVFSDFVGPMKHQLTGSSKYFEMLLDAGSGYYIERFIHRTSEAAETVMGMIQKFETLFSSIMRHIISISRNLMKIRSDGGGE